jgi:hypothetical protein
MSAEARRMTKKLVSDRMVVSKADLEKKLTGYLRKAGRCIDAAGVVISPVAAATPDQANWTISAVKYGKAPKADCDDELTRIAPLFLRHFNIKDESAEAAAEAAAAAPQDEAAEEVSAA